jgi:hypothetical protein
MIYQNNKGASVWSMVCIRNGVDNRSMVVCENANVWWEL